jgi:hypothetical protein
MPKAGKGAALVLPHGDTAAMDPRLAEIIAPGWAVPGERALLLPDQAGCSCRPDAEVHGRRLSAS